MADREAIGRWVLETCLLFGAEMRTALLVGAAFVEQLDLDESRISDPDPYMPKCCLCGRYHYGGCG